VNAEYLAKNERDMEPPVLREETKN
jgi:hypothetical protein